MTVWSASSIPLRDDAGERQPSDPRGRSDPHRRAIHQVIIDELPLRRAMYGFPAICRLVSLGIAMLTAGLVYLALHYLFVRPMRRLTASLVGFHENPRLGADYRAGARL